MSRCGALHHTTAREDQKFAGPSRLLMLQARVDIHSGQAVANEDIPDEGRSTKTNGSEDERGHDTEDASETKDESLHTTETGSPAPHQTSRSMFALDLVTPHTNAPLEPEAGELYVRVLEVMIEKEKKAMREFTTAVLRHTVKRRDSHAAEEQDTIGPKMLVQS
jgi:hypothetical protein